MAQQVKVHITIAGELVTPFSGVSINQDVHQHHTFEVFLPAKAFQDTGRAILDQSKKYIGQECHIRFAPDLFKSNQPENEFIGIVTEVRLSRQSNGKRTVILHGYSPTILMEGQPQCRTYTELKLDKIVEYTLEAIPHSLSTEIYTQFNETLPYTVQYNESNYRFLQRMAARYGEWCFYDGTQLVFGKLPRENKVELPLVKDLFNLEFTFKLLPVNFKVYSYDYNNTETYSSDSDIASVDGLEEYGKFALDESAHLFGQTPSRATRQNIASQSELDALVTYQKTGAANNMVMMTGTSDNPFLNVGSIINVTGETTNEQDYGEFIITSLSHNVGSSLDYQNSFTAVPAELESPPPFEAEQPTCEMQSAVVMNNEDPDKLGRVQVQFPWQESSGETTPWIRVSQAYGGHGFEGEQHGFYFIPEVGTEVTVGFEHNNPEKPFAISSLYNSESSPQNWSVDNNQTKVIKTRNGNQVHFIDEGGKERIRIFHRDVDNPTNEICLEMEGDGKITIKTEGQLDISAKSINIEAQENIDISAGNNMKVDVGAKLEEKANSIDVTANQAMGISAGTEVSVDGGTKVAVSGGADASVKGGANLSLEGSAMASLKGGIVKIN